GDAGGDRPRPPDPQSLHPAGRLSRGRGAAADRRPRVRRRLPGESIRSVSMAGSGGTRDQLRAAAASVPVGRAAAQSGADEPAVAYGLEHTGRIITAAALIMIAAFAGFTAGRFVGLQEFGVGLSAAILLDATVVRALLVPAAMKLLGHWNWYLPDGVRRAMRLTPAPS